MSFNAVLGVGLLAVGAVAFLGRDRIFDSSSFSNITIPTFSTSQEFSKQAALRDVNSLQRQIDPIENEIARASSFISSTQSTIGIQRKGGNPKLGRIAPCPNHRINSPAAKACRASQLQRLQSDQNKLTSIKISREFIENQQKQLTLLRAQQNKIREENGL